MDRTGVMIEIPELAVDLLASGAIGSGEVITEAARRLAGTIGDEDVLKAREMIVNDMTIRQCDHLSIESKLDALLTLASRLRSKNSPGTPDER